MLKIAKGVDPSCFKCSAYRFLFSKNKTFHGEVDRVVCGSRIQSRGRSYAASVPSEPTAERSRKKISREERKAMVECFVNEYRTSHDGKFPSITDARKNVGGSFYTIRKIVQELEYRSKMSSSETGIGSFRRKELNKEIKVCEDVDIQIEFPKKAASDVDIIDIPVRHPEAVIGSLPSSIAEKNLFEEIEKPTTLGGEVNLMKEDIDDPPSSSLRETEEMRQTNTDNVGTQSHTPKEEIGEVTHQAREKVEDDGNKGKSLPLHQLDSDGAKHEEEQFEGNPELEKNAVDARSRQENDVEVPKRSTLWGNLKTFADGFMKMLRKQ